MTSNSDDLEKVLQQNLKRRAMFWVLTGFITLAVIAGLAVGRAYGWILLPWSVWP
jgi:hypothetical protein